MIQKSKRNIQKSNILITGGCGFIGSNFIHFLLNNPSFQGKVINVDKLTYAGNRNNLRDIETQFLNNRYLFEQIDICNFNQLKEIFLKYDLEVIVHFAAESHVDRSIHAPAAFIQTDIIGTFNLLELAKKRNEQGKQISSYLW